MGAIIVFMQYFQCKYATATAIVSLQAVDRKLYSEVKRAVAWITDTAPIIVTYWKQSNILPNKYVKSLLYN